MLNPETSTRTSAAAQAAALCSPIPKAIIMADTSIPTIAFKNDLTYDIVIYDSFDDEDSDDDANASFFGTLTSLGTVGANSTVNIQPIHRSSAFIIESAADKKPVKRCTKLGSNKTLTSFEIAKADEDAMTATFQLINLVNNTPADPVAAAFKKILSSDDIVTDMNAFFQQQPAYASCTFQTYMMAVTYLATLPPAPATPAVTYYSLSKMAAMMGATWPGGLPDVAVSNFKVTDKNSVLVISGDIDISTLSFESPQISANVARILGDKKVLTFDLIFNHGVNVGIFGTRLILLLDTIDIPAGSSQVHITKPTITIDINPLFKFVVFTLTGTIPFNVFSKSFDANLSLTVDNVEAAIGVVIAGDHASLPAPPVIKGVHFNEFGVGMGIIFSPPAFALGLQGKFHIGDGADMPVDIADDTFAVVCKFDSEVPEPVYASFYVPKMDINQVLAMFTNAGSNLDVPVTFTDLSFKWAENPMEPFVLPDGTLSEMAYGFSAAASVFAFQFFGDVEVDMNNGLTANIQASPVALGNVFKLSGDGPGVTIKVDASGNPIKNNQIRDSKVLQDALAAAVDKQMVAPGGPVLAIQTFSSPFLHVKANASLFELAGVAIEADIDKTGIRFLLDYGAVLKEKMSVTLSDFHNLAASFEYYMNTTITIPPVGGVKMGSFTLAADVEAHLAIQTSLSDITMKFGGSFDFEGLKRTFGDFNADINIKKMTDLIGAGISWIEAQATQLFGEFLGDAGKWASRVKSGFITGCDEVGTVLYRAFKKDDASVVAGIMKAAGFAADEIAGNIKNAWKCGITDVTYAMRAAGFSPQDIAAGMQKAFNAADQDVANAYKALSYTANDVAGVAKSVYGQASAGTAVILKNAGYAAQDASNALQATFNSGVDDITSAMKTAGYAAQDVASSIKNTFNISVSAVSDAMKQAGYVADDIKNAFESLGGDFANFASEVWNKINPSNW
ncbi:phage tail tape measure protein [Dyadobacter flavalbus]|uniref:Phage tail tape measure protein n=1 Tax=Dyadobacter flavalbus TaxID=2579942 RepID=A0A5M8QTQ4_9BACT|nr:phage tail tape measure protein [Dyadobacter flavalbus]KAA6438430.1 phage tail tape measure protein [Dyadobacter flavalbus]